MEYDQNLEECAKEKSYRSFRRLLQDEIDAIQKKTFTKWVNKHLKKCGKCVGDLFVDLPDGHNLLSLLEVLSGEHLSRERGRMRFHKLQNVQTALDFLRYRKVKLVNIRAEDIVDGNPKLILGLIWTTVLHFQISDIVMGMEENVSAKDVLLKWAQKSTAKYPGVGVTNFTSSWKDGLAFNAILHRNRPDLIDWRSVQRRSVRERLENAFTVAERDCDVTRLLDAEDVDTPQPDEKSLITYISSLYDAFPEPPRLHPLYDTDSQKKWEEYRETASVLYTWISQNLTVMQDRHFSSSLIEMRRMAAEMTRFRVEEVPPRNHDKQRLAHLFRDVEKHFRDGEIDRELHIENIEKNWQILLMAHQEKDQAIHDEIKKLEKLQRLAEKIHREAKQVEIRLDEIEQRIEGEAKRIDRLHPSDAKHNLDQLERDMQMAEDNIKSMFTDAQTLRDSRYSQSNEIHKMVQHLHQRWISIRTLMHNRLLSVLASISFPIEEKSVTRMSKTVLETRLVETNSHFRFLQEVGGWIKGNQKQLQDADYGSDLPSVQAELEKQHKEHLGIEKFQGSVDKCSSAKSSFHGDELQLYINYLNGVQKSYTELLISSKKRTADLETLMDFVQSATNELIWLSEKEEREITRDWSSKSLNLVEVEQYYEALMSELVQREIQFNAVRDRGESLHHHPASKCIETYMSTMQTQWAWLLQLTICLETHLKHVATYQQYFSDIKECEQTIARKEEMLNTVFSKSDFSLDEGELLLKEMQELREDLTKYGEVIQSLSNQSREIIPLKQRKMNINHPITVTAICNYKQNNQQMVINKDERCTLRDNSQRVRWRITNSLGLEVMVPSVCFLIPPPDKESLDAAERLRREYDKVVTLWQKKRLKMRQNMIFATITVVKSWDLAQFLAMGAEKRIAIRKALNEDADKLIQEGDPTDPALRRLRREIDEVNKLFDEFECKAMEAETSMNTSKVLIDQVATLQNDLDGLERILVSRVNAPIPRDLDSLERYVIEHKEYESRIQMYESRVETIQQTYASIPQKTAALQTKLDRVVEKWERIRSLSHLYVERLKCVKIVWSSLEETNTYVSQFEMKLSSYENLPIDDDGLKRVSDDLLNLQNTAQVHQHKVDRMIEDTKNVRRVTEKSRGTQKRHTDIEKLEDEVHRTATRWTSACTQVIERLRTVEVTSEHASRYNTSYQTEMNWLDRVDNKAKSLPLVEGSGAKRKINPHMTLYNSVIEEKITIEQVNTMGARLAKEARKYDVMVDNFRESLQDVLPSLDSRPAKEVIIQELDILNLKYQLLVDNLYHRIQQLAVIAGQEDPNFDLASAKVPAPSPITTYRMHMIHRDSTSQFAIIPIEKEVERPVQQKKESVKLQETPVPQKINDKEDDTVEPKLKQSEPEIAAITSSLEEIPKSVEAPGKKEQKAVEEKVIVEEKVTPQIARKPQTARRPPPTTTSAVVAKSQLPVSTKDQKAHAKDTQFTSSESAVQITVTPLDQIGTETRLATEAHYKQCEQTVHTLTDWLSDIEKRLANEETLRETVEELRKQTMIVKSIRDEIDDRSQMVGTCLDQIRHLVATGGEVLSSEEISTLEKNGKAMKNRYDRVSDQSEKLYRKLMTASDELKKYKAEVSTFKVWMEKSIRVLEDKERNINNLSTSGRDNTKEFVSDVIAHQGDLRFITMSAQKFVEESREYLQTLNEFRRNFPQRLPYLKSRDSAVKEEVTQLTSIYQDLLSRANKLYDRLSQLGNKQKDFQDALNKALAWLKEVTPRAQKVLSEPVAGEPKLVEDQLSRAKALQNDILSNGRLIDSVRQTASNLLNSMEELTPAERNAIEGAANDLQTKYQNLLDAIGEKIKDLDSALVQSQGLQDSVDSVSNWLSQAENQMRSIFKPASLIRERLDEQIREVKMLQADIDSDRPSLESMARSADDLMRSGTARVSKKVEAKLKDVLARYEKLVEKLVQRAVFLQEVSTHLDSFLLSANSFDQWFADMFEVLETRLTGDDAAARLEEVMRRKEARKQEFDEMITNGRTLVAKKDVMDTVPVKDKIKALETQWKELTAALDEKSKFSKSRADALNAYEKLRDQVQSWLTNMETRVNNLQHVSVELDIIKNQNDEFRPIAKEHRDYNTTIDKVNELGAAYDAMTRGERIESPRRRGLASSPVKRPSFRASAEPRSPSPTKALSGFDGRSPMSPSGSSGFGSRRSSQEGFLNLEDASPVQQQLNEINQRYQLIGMKLSDRQSDLDSTRDEVKKIADNLKALAQFLEKEERLMPKDTIPQSREEADKMLRTIKSILEDIYDKQGLLDNTRIQVSDLLRRKPNALGADNLQNTFETINSKWKDLQDRCKQKVKFLENMKEFHDNYDNLNNWLTSKDKMLGVLGPIASDPRMVQSQMQQVHVIRDEFRAQKPILDSFNNGGDEILSQTNPNTPDGRKIEDKLATVNQKWNDLLHKLDDREGNLEQASGASTDFYNNLNKLQDNLHKISDDLDDLIAEKGEPDEMLKKLESIERNLNNQRPILADVEAAGDILQDPTAKFDIKQKLGQVGRLYNQCQKKLDNCKAELENSRKDVLDFNEACDDAQNWLQSLLAQLMEKLLVSADRDTLRRQVATFDPIYKDVMGKEHEIIMTINKGKDLIKTSRKNKQRLIQQNIEKIQKSWERLRKETVDRQSRLQSFNEHCKKYDKSLEPFVKWLVQAEDKMETFRLTSFKKADIDKLIKEVNTFKNELWRRTGDYETTRNNGDTFVSSCDKDKEGIEEELQDLKERWEALSAAILAKAQELEDAAARLSEFNDNCRDVKNALGRCEDQLASHDALGDASRDPKLLKRIKAIEDEAKKLAKPLDNVTRQGEDLVPIREAVDDVLNIMYCAETAQLPKAGNEQSLENVTDKTMQRLLVNVHWKANQVKIRLMEIDKKFAEEVNRINHLHPLDARYNYECLESDMQMMKVTIKSIVSKAQTLCNSGYSQSYKIHETVHRLRNQWTSILEHNNKILLSALDSFQ